MLLVHRRDIVEAVEIRDRLQIGFVLDQLLGAAMKQADMRIDPLHHLAVEFKHKAQDAVAGCWGPKLIVKLRSEGSAMSAETITPGQRPSCALVPSAADLKFAPSKTEIPCQS